MTAKVFLKKNEDRRIKSGHLWIFSNEIHSVEGLPENGDLVEIYNSRSEFLGKGFYNKNSLIAVRILKFQQGQDLYSFLKEKITEAFNYRKKFYPSRNSFRLIFSESDYLPGLIIDKYNDTYVLQIYSTGMENNIEIIVDILRLEFNAKNIFTKNESYFRKLEGLPEEDKIYSGEIAEEIIDDGLIKYRIDFNTGHKTGFYFDQSDNRFFFGKICEGLNALDAFCNSGGFGLQASYNKAKSVTFVDSSQTILKSAQDNFKLNNLNSEKEFIAADVFEYLTQCKTKNKLFDVINIDPPAFAKNKKSLPAAIKGYEKLNRLSLEIIEDGGFLSTSSCSYHLNESEFLTAINNAAVKCGKTLQLIHFNRASLDHPKLSAMPETSYLKYAVFKVHNS